MSPLTYCNSNSRQKECDWPSWNHMITTVVRGLEDCGRKPDKNHMGWMCGWVVTVTRTRAGMAECKSFVKLHIPSTHPQIFYLIKPGRRDKHACRENPPSPSWIRNLTYDLLSKERKAFLLISFLDSLLNFSSKSKRKNLWIQKYIDHSLQPKD